MNKIENVDELRTAINVYKQLQKIARSLHHLDEVGCDRGLTARQERSLKEMEQRAHSFAQELGLHAWHQSDPRGCTLYLVDHEDASTDYNNGIPVY